MPWLLLIAGAGAGAGRAQTGDVGVEALAGADRLVELVNAERASAGLRALVVDARLQDEARAHSARMAAVGTIFHNDDLFTRETKARLGAKIVGENVALNPSIDDAHARLMASDGHRANILRPGFDRVGIALHRGDDTWYITEVFAESTGAAPPAPAPAPPPPAPAAAAPAPAPAPPPPAPAPVARAATPVPRPPAAPAAAAPAPPPALTAPPAVAVPPAPAARAPSPEASRRSAPPLPRVPAEGLLAAAALAMVVACARSLVRVALRFAPAG